MQAPILLYVAEASCFLPAGAGLFQWKKLNSPLKILTLFFCFSVLHVIAEETLRRMSINNLFLQNIHQVVEVESFLYFFWTWSKQRILKDGIQYAAMIYLVVWTLNKVYFEQPEQFNESMSTIANFFLIVVSIFVLLELSKTATVSLLSHTIFWIGSGTILYFSGTIIIFSLSNTILQIGFLYFDIFWHFNWSLVIIVNLMFARSFWCKIF
ncbi:MAG: hypothetical protein Q8L88_07520 [Bacteroidota bacterium]|nr:hypothetical protein [Bacteroidota bacterium]